jgi:hypothetical protein
MRRKRLAQLSRAPANCNSQGAERSLGFTDCAQNYGGDQYAWCLRRATIVQGHEARRLWLLARELCASAALYWVEGGGSAAGRTLRLAFAALRDRAEIAQAEPVGD